MSNTTGGSNIALGYGAGQNLTTGSNNIRAIAAGLYISISQSAVTRLGEAADCYSSLPTG